MDRFSLKLFFFQALAILSCVASSAQAPLHDVSNRISLKEKFMVGGFNDASLDGFTSGPSVEIALSDVSELWGSPHEGKGAMIVKPASGLPASEWRTVSKTFDKPRNLSRYTAVEFGILTQEGPAVDQWVRLRLLSGRKSFDCMAQIIPTLWRTVIFDVSGCKFLGKVTGIEIGLMSPTDAPWDGGRYFILDGLCFGKPLDLNFMTPASVDGFTCRGGKVSWDDDALVCKFARGSVLRFPDLSGSRNMMYNPPLGSDLERSRAGRAPRTSTSSLIPARRPVISTSRTVRSAKATLPPSRLSPWTAREGNGSSARSVSSSSTVSSSVPGRYFHAPQMQAA